MLKYSLSVAQLAATRISMSNAHSREKQMFKTVLTLFRGSVAAAGEELKDRTALLILEQPPYGFEGSSPSFPTIFFLLRDFAKRGISCKQSVSNPVSNSIFTFRSLYATSFVFFRIATRLRATRRVVSTLPAI
jgi:hypothetical protein